MVHQITLFFFFLLSWNTVRAQDERYYRQIFTGELPKLVQEHKEAPLHQYNLMGPAYRLDLNADGIEETLRPQKRDGVDWLEIRDASERKIMEAKLPANGGNGHLYKIRLMNLSPKLKTLVLFMDEGETRGKRFEATARLYFISFENNDFSTLSLSQGPHFFHEREAQREQYWRRIYLVDALDFNQDGTKEIIVHYNHIQRVYMYEGKGHWRKF